MNTSKVTRLELIDYTKPAEARSVVAYSESIKVEVSLQDDGRTLKIFVSERNGIDG